MTSYIAIRTCYKASMRNNFTDGLQRCASSFHGRRKVKLFGATLESFSCLFSGLTPSLERGFLRLPSTRNTARKLLVVFKSSWLVEIVCQARRSGDVSL